MSPRCGVRATKPPSRVACVAQPPTAPGVTEKIAKFQVYEGLLQATDTALWAAWMANGTTPGYVVKPVKYVCRNGSGLGVSCRGQPTICKRLND